MEKTLLKENLKFVAQMFRELTFLCIGPIDLKNGILHNKTTKEPLYSSQFAKAAAATCRLCKNRVK